MAQVPDKPVFRWLHISDLHIADNTNIDDLSKYIIEGAPNSHDQYEEKGLHGILQDHNKDHVGVDCIVVTGDFFHKGNHNKQAVGKVTDFINQIYNECKKVGNWDESSTWDRLCFCPGNHDLDRKARKNNNIRSDCVNVETKKGKAYLEAADQSRTVIVQSAFKKFYSTVKLSKRNNVKNYGNGQVICFSPSPISKSFKPNVIFVGLNTALLAGQIKECDEFSYKIEARITKLLQDVRKHLDRNKREYKEAKKQCKQAIDDAMLVNGDYIDDYGKLCLPDKEIMDDLRSYLEGAETPLVPILFGHHSIDFFNLAAKQELTSLIRDCRIPLYLCGHSHRLGDTPINMTSYSRVQNTSCLEVVTGGLFYDKEKYNQISFSIGTIEWDETLSQYSATIDYYVCLYAIGDRTGKIGNWLHGQSKWPPKDSFPLSFPQPASSQDRESAERPKNKKNQEANTNYEERSGQPSPPLKNLPLPDDPLRIKNLLIDRKSGRDSQQRKGEKNEC